MDRNAVARSARRNDNTGRTIVTIVRMIILGRGVRRISGIDEAYAIDYQLAILKSEMLNFDT